MQTYHYRFPAYGKLGGKEDVEGYTRLLESNLNDGSDCLMAWCIFPTDSVILDRVEFEIENEQVKAVNIHTYTELWDNSEGDFKNCIEENLANTSQEYFGGRSYGVIIEGDVEHLGRKGEIPEKLYHIADRKDMYDIMQKDGLIPRIGENNYKNHEAKIFLTDEKDLAPWLAVLKHKDDPVILEIETEGLNIETGRTFKDRDFVEGGRYGEYFTTESIPVSHIQETDLGNGSNIFSINLRNTMLEQLGNATAEDEIAEVQTGLERLAGLGLIDEEKVKLLIEHHMDKLTQEDGLKDNCEMGRKIGETGSMGIDEELPWDVNDAGRDLTVALGRLSSDSGIKLD